MQESFPSTARFKRYNPLTTAAACVIIIAGLKAASSLLVPAAFAAVLAVIGAPAVHWLRRHYLPATAAVLLVILGLTGILAAAALLLGNSVDAFAGAIGGYQQRILQLMQRVVSWIQARGIPVDGAPFVRALNPGVLMELASSMFEGLLGVLSHAFLVLVLLMFILLEMTGFRAKLVTAFGGQWRVEHVAQLMGQIQRYLGVKTAMGVATGVAIGIWASIIGVDFPWLWALLAFLFNYVPFIGQFFAATPPILLALIQLGTGRALVLTVGYAVINAILTSVEPLLMGRRLRLSPLIVFLSLAFWGFVWGPVGMLLAVPLTVILKLALEASDELRWMAALMDAPPRPAEALAARPDDPPSA